MEAAMRKEITRLNEIIGKGCVDGKAQASGKKVDEPKGPQYKKGRHPCWHFLASPYY
jgi:hypothetical protein